MHQPQDTENTPNIEIISLEHNPTAKAVVDMLTELDKNTISDKSVDYKTLYYRAFNGISDILDKLAVMERHPSRDFFECCKGSLRICLWI